MEQDFRLKNVGAEPIFSEFLVTNPETQGEYRVAIRGQGLGDNFCSCPDFAVNTLGTCKHIEWALAKLQNKRGGKKALAEGFHPAYSEVYLRYGAQREVAFRAGKDCPKALQTETAKYFNKQGILRATGYARFDKFLHKVGQGKHEIRCYEDAIDFVAEVRDRTRLRKRVDRAFPKGIGSVAFKKLLKVSLYRYQREGALFAARAGRSLIADDMGLGKTIQAIAAVEILAKTVGIERVLIVCPTSLKHQWQQEIAKFAEREATVVEGLITQREKLYQAKGFYKIVNYEVIHRDLEAIEAWGPEMIILDEAQRIKNWNTRRAQSVKQLKSPYAIVLTGTPLENRLEELHSIVEFVDRFRLGPTFRFLSEHQHVDERGKVVGYHSLSKIGKSLEPILIRRTKDQVLKQLPERLDKNYFVPMTQEQREHHDENQETVARIAAKWAKYHYLSESDQRRLMVALQNMRMSCDSTYLLDPHSKHGIKPDEFLTVLDELFEQPETKVVVFSQWLRMHELLRERLDAKGHKHLLFHGGVPGKKRKDLIHRFKSDPQQRVFLATDAGGVGLNLQNASAVINMDLPWNPAVLEQRIGRVHRLGQHRPVRVINFVAQGSIEEGMLGVLSFKQSLFTGVLDNGQDEVFLGGTRLKRFMQTVEKATSNIPAPMPQDPAPTAEPGTESPVTPEPVNQPWSDLVTTGLSFLDKLRGVMNTEPGKATDTGTPAKLPVAIETDKTTGQSFLKLPVPTKDLLQ
ncbi:DEAD/DEAH box helicase, partial [Planctomycetota bacterium]